ncbi:MAG TPA: hypothetical protein VHJ76_04360, partial [Actinomycetota bacterium]|nr:hypothetical protein [Actinomycetota bacterium]
IETRTIKYHSGPTWIHGGSDPWGPVALWVKRSQYEDSRIVLAEVSFEAPDHVRDAPVARGWRVPFVWWATALGLGALVTGAALADVANAVFARCRVPIFCSND